MNVRISVCAILASVTLAAGQDNSDARQWTLSDLDAPVSQLLGLPRWFRLGGQYRGRLEDDSALSFVPGASDTYYLDLLSSGLVRVSHALYSSDRIPALAGS
jgi:hypothetical protein